MYRSKIYTIYPFHYISDVFEIECDSDRNYVMAAKMGDYRPLFFYYA